MADIVLPNGWEPREHQLALWRYMQGGGLRAVPVWHRRAGKDSTALNWTVVASQMRIGTYWHMLPEKEQARKAMWNGIDREGRRIIDQAWPQEMRANTIDDEMRIATKHGSMWQVVGSDNYNSLVGTNPIGVVFSEYSVGDPAAWNFIRPILAENGGWAIFPYTPRGQNHGHKLYRMAEKNPDWFAQVLTVDDTGIISPDVIQAERDSGMDDDMVDQEYFCSWQGVRQGSIFGLAMAKMRSEGRIAHFPYDRRHPVQTFWDIGHSDTTAIVCHQEIGGWDRIIASHEQSGQDTTYFVQWLKDTGFMFGRHYLPHDAKNVTLASKGHQLGDSTWDQLFTLGLRDLELVPRIADKWVGINSTRMRLDTVQINEPECETLINAMDSYHKKWDDNRNCYLNDPVHDWSSNYADAMRQWATGYKGQRTGMTFTAPQSLIVKAGTRLPPGKMITVGNRRTGY